MKLNDLDYELKGKEEAKLETYRTAIKDARHVFTVYKDAHPDEAWDCLRRIIFDHKLK